MDWVDWLLRLVIFAVAGTLIAAGTVVVLTILALFWPWDEDHERRRPGL